MSTDRPASVALIGGFAAGLLTMAVHPTRRDISCSTTSFFATRANASRELFDFIEIWYNRQRRHSSLDYRSTAQFEAELLKAS